MARVLALVPRRTMMAVGPFESDQIDKLLEEDPNKPGLARRRESSHLEFKRNFHRNSSSRAEYARTMAAMANRSGGYLLFGVEDKPHLLSGLPNRNFHDSDPAEFTNFLDDRFSPAIEWEQMLVSSQGKDFGLIYVAESSAKPVICSTSSTGDGALRDGDIYYRYSGRSSRIRSAELNQIIRSRIDAQADSWREMLQRMATVTPSSSYILDLESGRVEGEAGRILLSEELLEKVRFIHKGRFTEGGDPALRIVGDVELAKVEVIDSGSTQQFIDPSEACNIYTERVVQKHKAKIGDSVPWGNGRKFLTGVDVRTAVEVLKIESPSRFYYRPLKDSRPMYSEEFIDLLCESYSNDQDFFFKNKQATNK